GCRTKLEGPGRGEQSSRRERFAGGLGGHSQSSMVVWARLGRRRNSKVIMNLASRRRSENAAQPGASAAHLRSNRTMYRAGWAGGLGGSGPGGGDVTGAPGIGAIVACVSSNQPPGKRSR